MPVLAEKTVASEKVVIPGAGILPANVRVVPVPVDPNLVPSMAVASADAVNHEAVHAEAGENPLIDLCVPVADNIAAAQEAGNTVGFRVGASFSLRDGAILRPVVGRDPADQFLRFSDSRIIVRVRRDKRQNLLFPKLCEACSIRRIYSDTLPVISSSL